MRKPLWPEAAETTTGAVLVRLTGWIYVEPSDEATDLKQCAEDKARQLRGIDVDECEVLDVEED